MDDPNITMEEYIKLGEEKAQKHGKVFNWETAKCGKIGLQEWIWRIRVKPICHMALPPRDQTHQYLRVQVYDFEVLPNLMAEGLSGSMLMEHRDAQGQSVFTSRAWSAYWAESARDLVLRLCYRLIACSIVGRSQASKKVTVADLFYLRGWTLAQSTSLIYCLVRELLVIDMSELVRLHICEEIDDTKALVASELERHPDAVAGSPGAAEDDPIVDEGDQAILAPVQAPQPPPVARNIP
uniref:Uncharacterized protein n=1 Tax=Tanacetum cinerariifolium TaxID=118510 RepID=A0A699HX66_TANCI|nr:hypothetical protein [Tanacetum cinerariifolium]